MSENNLQLFMNKRFGEIRTIQESGKVLFVATDIANALGYSKPADAVARHCRYTTKRSIPHPQSPDKTIGVNVIPEGDVYRLLAKSEMPYAEQFERWIFDEVLPTIRAAGGYVQDSAMFVDAYLPGLPLAAKQMLTASLEENRRLYSQIEQQKPLVTFAETCLSSKDSVLVREVAKVACKEGVDIGEKRLWKKLRDWNLILSGSTEPSQYAMNLGLFEVKERPIATAYEPILRSTTMVTPKGQVHIIEKLRKEHLQ